MQKKKLSSLLYLPAKRELKTACLKDFFERNENMARLLPKHCTQNFSCRTDDMDRRYMIVKKRVLVSVMQI